MEKETKLAAPAPTLMPSASIIPKKRKEPPAEDDFPPGTFKTGEDQSMGDSSPSSQTPKGEYETGRVICEACGDGISFRDEENGTFTVKHWDAHRLECPNAAQQTTETPQYTQEPQNDTPTQPPSKRRRAKRTEDERIEYLRTDPYVAKFEAYRVLCASCDKWIRLRPNSTYCSIPWDAHRKSCLAKRVAKNTLPGEDRSSLFANDPNVRKFDAERVQCKICESWVPLGSTDNMTAIQTWLNHRTACLENANSNTTAPSTSNSRPAIANVPPPSKHLMALVSSSSRPLPPPANRASDSKLVGTSASAPAQAGSPTAFKDLTPTFTPVNESRRRNAEQRAAALRSDDLIGQVEPNRVFCSLCQKWVQLRQDSSYCAYPWLQHRNKCLNRQIANHKRSQKENGIGDSSLYEFSPVGDDTDDPESEEGVVSGDDDEKAKRRAERKDEKRKAKEIARAARMKKEEERRKMLSQKALPPALAFAASDPDADGEYEWDPDYQPRLADLNTIPGRLEFAFKSVRYLFKTTYERSDDLTIATLVTYLNAAIPPDKHEDFDTTEVTKAAIALHERGDFVLEGDTLRLPD